MMDIEQAQKMDIALNGMARAVDSVIIQEFGNQFGFALLVFEYGDDKAVNYISSAQRKHMINVLRILADRLEARQDIPPSFGSIQ